jgi:hypothetical protein
MDSLLRKTIDSARNTMYFGRAAVRPPGNVAPCAGCKRDLAASPKACSFLKWEAINLIQAMSSIYDVLFATHILSLYAL